MFNNKLLISLAIVAVFLHGCHNGEQKSAESSRRRKSAVSKRGSWIPFKTIMWVWWKNPFPFRSVSLQAEPLNRYMADEGTHVKKGQLLASLNSDNYRNALQLTAAKEKQAKDAYDRLSEVYKNGSLPEVKMVEMETGLEQANAAAQIATKNLADCKLYSPANGIIGKRSIEPGMNVIPGITVLTIVKIDKVFIRVSIPENEIVSTNVGQQALIRVPALKDHDFPGTDRTKRGHGKSIVAHL